MKIHIDVEDVLDIDKRRKAFNLLTLEDIEFYEKGVKISIDPEILPNFRFMGLSNLDFITSGYYKEIFAELQK